MRMFDIPRYNDNCEIEQFGDFVKVEELIEYIRTRIKIEDRPCCKIALNRLLDALKEERI